VAIQVMRVGHVRVRMPDRPVPVHVAVLALGHRLMDMTVMAVVVAMRMLVLEVMASLRRSNQHCHSGQWAPGIRSLARSG
jgi:hypothetical protein